MSPIMSSAGRCLHSQAEWDTMETAKQGSDWSGPDDVTAARGSGRGRGRGVCVCIHGTRGQYVSTKVDPLSPYFMTKQRPSDVK